MEPMVYDHAASGLTAGEQAVLREGGLRFERRAGRDLVAEGVARFAALVARSLKPDAVAKKLGVTPGRVHQLLSDRSLYSFRLDGKRMVPDFQFRAGRMVPNIGQVNKLLPKKMHPLGILGWYQLPNLDLVIDEQTETALSPLDWLAMGHNPKAVKALAGSL